VPIGVAAAVVVDRMMPGIARMPGLVLVRICKGRARQGQGGGEGGELDCVFHGYDLLLSFRPTLAAPALTRAEFPIGRSGPTAKTASRSLSESASGRVHSGRDLCIRQGRRP